ncbi:hypothetical protein [Abyssibacter sp.]|uniref:hypothetical protein n=1 Tax=Abyssibacter sp. TaxID=2320200 RepID=UPI0025C6CA0B|nr:hypothetical protein [Abyssibacter sp.]MCK5858327.1 hypothetical protein [Abyssibacter sp.]
MVFDVLGAEERQYTQSQLSTRTLSAEQDIQVLQAHDRGLIQRLTDATAPDVVVSPGYCSIYEQCWSMDQGNGPQPVALCDWPEDERFLQ